METVKKFIKEHPHMWWGLYLPVYLTMFFIIEHLITDNYWATQTAIDDYIPFCEWFIFPYDAWAFLLVAIGLYLIVKDGEGFRRYMWTIMITFTTATVFCALVPNGQDLRPAVMEHHNIAAWLLQNTYALDTNTNVFPSVHVLGVIAAVSAVWHTPGLRKWGWRAGSLALGIVIIAATLVTAASVCVTGMIGWVGLVIPHLCRMLVGADYRRLIPASMLMGASFLLIVDDVARLATTAEIPIGILTAFVGAPFFLYLITRKKKL